MESITCSYKSLKYIEITAFWHVLGILTGGITVNWFISGLVTGVIVCMIVEKNSELAY